MVVRRAVQNGSPLRPPRTSIPGGRVSVFATDLDRTLLPRAGGPTRTGQEALRRVRELGLRTVLVSGRPLEELHRYAQAFGGFDGIVAENGAVVEAPFGTPPKVEGRRVGVAVRRTLEGRAAFECEFGEVVASLPRSAQPGLARTFAFLPVRIVPNIDRVMVLPQGVTKRTGTRRALRQMGLSGSDYAAIGDGENDVDLLRGASLSGAVANAVPEVRRVAQFVCRRSFDHGVLEFITGPLARKVRADDEAKQIKGVRR